LKDDDDDDDDDVLVVFLHSFSDLTSEVTMQNDLFIVSGDLISLRNFNVKLIYELEKRYLLYVPSELGHQCYREERPRDGASHWTW
jgi:hypothetical protein